MHRQKRKRNVENDDDLEMSSQSESKKCKSTDVIENNNNDSFDQLIFEESDADDNPKEATTEIVEIDKLNALKINVATESKQKRKHNWTQTEWESLEEVEEFLESEGFVLFDEKNLKIGQKFYFRCNEIPKDRKRDQWCAPQYIIFLPSDSKKIILQFNGCEHNHNALLSTYKLRPISNNMKVFITDLFESGITKTNVILKTLSKARNTQQLFVDEPDPTPRQLSYLLSKYRQQDAQPVVKMGDLSKWCEERMTFPSNPDDAFVIGYDCSTTENSQSFRFCMSTPHLLNILSSASVISIDATCKLNWMEYPLIILGMVDNMKRFHPMVYGSMVALKSTHLSLKL